MYNFRQCIIRQTYVFNDTSFEISYLQMFIKIMFLTEFVSMLLLDIILVQNFIRSLHLLPLNRKLNIDFVRQPYCFKCYTNYLNESEVIFQDPVFAFVTFHRTNFRDRVQVIHLLPTSQQNSSSNSVPKKLHTLKKSIVIQSFRPQFSRRQCRYHPTSAPSAMLVLLITQSFKSTKMGEVSNSIVFKQFLGVSLIEYFT